MTPRIVVTGCAHPVMRGILDAASRLGKLYGIAGGLHQRQAIGEIKNAE